MFQSYQTDEVILRLRLNDLIIANKIRPQQLQQQKFANFKKNNQQTTNHGLTKS
jgi:hypothetical protein